MKKHYLYTIILLSGLLLNNSIVIAQVGNNKSPAKSSSSINSKLINTTIITDFYKNYPDYKKYQVEVTDLYKKRKFASIWFQGNELIEFANVLYSNVSELEKEGIDSTINYKNKIDQIFDSNASSKPSQVDTELLLSTLYVLYASKVYHGMDESKTKELGWFLPRKSISYDTLLDSLLVKKELYNSSNNELIGQYYKLREELQKYREIEKLNSWNKIEKDSLFENFGPNETSKTIAQIRNRLFVLGDIPTDSKSTVYDDELKKGILSWKVRNGFTSNYLITSLDINRLNIPIKTYISTIMVNMERCRWIDPAIATADEYISINIPSYTLTYNKNGVKELESKIFVGETLNKTVIFGGYISKMVFSPYWYIPQSIVKNELKSSIIRDPNYLKTHNIEWNNGNARQLPGPKNSLGLVKFMFPNINSIYLHDTPSKDLFKMDYRAYSHGCINMEKAEELAVLLLKDNKDWPEKKVIDAMNGKKETVCILKKKVPIYIGYFTTWVDANNVFHFYDDVYNRDEKLASLLFEQQKI